MHSNGNFLKGVKFSGEFSFCKRKLVGFHAFLQIYESIESFRQRVTFNNVLFTQPALAFKIRWHAGRIQLEALLLQVGTLLGYVTSSLQSSCFFKGSWHLSVEMITKKLKRNLGSGQIKFSAKLGILSQLGGGLSPNPNFLTKLTKT